MITKIDYADRSWIRQTLRERQEEARRVMGALHLSVRPPRKPVSVVIPAFLLTQQS